MNNICYNITMIMNFIQNAIVNYKEIHKILKYKYKHEIEINLNIYNEIINHITSNISTNSIYYINIINNSIIIKTNKSILNNLKSILINKYISIDEQNNTENSLQDFEYIITVHKQKEYTEFLVNKNLFMLQNKYKGNIVKHNNKIYLYTDELTINTNSGVLNIRILTNNATESFSMIMPKELQEMNLLNNYKMKASNAILQHNYINPIIVSTYIDNNMLILHLNESAFFQATEMFKNNKYQQLVVEINNAIVGQCQVHELIKQRMVLKFFDEKIMNEIHQNILYGISSIEYTQHNNDDNISIYTLMLLILLICILLYIFFIRKKYLKSILLFVMFTIISYHFKINDYLLINISLVFLLNELNINIKYYIVYSSAMILLLIYSQLSCMFNGALIHNAIYSLIFLIFKIANSN